MWEKVVGEMCFSRNLISVLTCKKNCRNFNLKVADADKIDWESWKENFRKIIKHNLTENVEFKIKLQYPYYKKMKSDLPLKVSYLRIHDYWWNWKDMGKYWIIQKWRKDTIFHITFWRTIWESLTDHVTPKTSAKFNNEKIALLLNDPYY